MLYRTQRDKPGRIIKLFIAPLLAILVLIGGLWVYQTTLDEKRPLTITFTGDVMLSRDIGKWIEREGYDYPYEHVRSFLEEDDYTIINLETPLTHQDEISEDPRIVSFKADPANAKALKENSVEVVNLSNNHLMDSGEIGLIETLIEVHKAGLLYYGIDQKRVLSDSLDIFENMPDTRAAINQQLEKDILVIENEDVRVGIMGFNNIYYQAEDLEHEWMMIQMYDEAVLEDIRSIDKVLLGLDYLIVTMHWGIEYEKYPNRHQKNIAHQLIDAGVDMIVGHHPHVTQTVEVYKDKKIYYSLGNFVFDRQSQFGTDQAYLLRLRFSKDKHLEVADALVVEESLHSISIDQGQAKLMNDE